MAEAVSGPGKHSRRTDRGPAQKLRELPDAQYGEAATYRDLQKQAPLSQTPKPKQARPSVAQPAASSGPQLTPLNAPTARPDEPVTAGADAGPGPGMAALGLNSPRVAQWKTTRDMLQALAAQNPQDSALAYLAARLQGRY
jgi:hypothetical protein